MVEHWQVIKSTMLKLVKRIKPLPEEIAKKTHILPDFENPPYKMVHGLPCFESIPVLNYLCPPAKKRDRLKY